MRRIWFVSHYSMPPQYEMRIKTQMYAHLLNEQGYETKIFSASTIHNTDVNLITGKEKYIETQYDDLNFVHIRCHGYKGNGIQRIFNMLEFAHKFKKYALRFPLPDAVVADVNCTNYRPVFSFCQKHNIPMYVDMRDLWPMSIVEYYKYSENNPIIQYLYRREKKMYRDVSGVLFNMEGWRDYLKDKGWLDELDVSKFHYINNGVDYEEFCKQISQNPFYDPDLERTDVFKVVYVGSIREANHLEPVVYAAKLLQRFSEKKIQILLYGDGDDCDRLRKLAESENISNIMFKGFVQKKLIPSILSKADACILNYKKAKTLKYGGSQNKLFEYLAVGKPIIMTVDMNYNIVTQNNVGIALSEPNPEDIAEGIIRLASLSEQELSNMSDRAKSLAQCFDYRVLTEKLISILKNGEKND